MPTKKSGVRWHAAPEVAAQLATAEEAEALANSPPVVAYEMPVEAAHAQSTTGKKRSRAYSRVHEVFTRDPNDTEYCICQSTEGVKGGRVCARSIKGSLGTKPLWNHVEKFHPREYMQLKDDGVNDVASTAADSLASSTSVAVNISYQQMVDALCSAPQDVLADAFEALRQAKDRRS